MILSQRITRHATSSTITTIFVNVRLARKSKVLNVGYLTILVAQMRLDERKDFGFLPDEAAEKNESAIQQITTFLTTERAKVIAALGRRSQ